MTDREREYERPARTSSDRHHDRERDKDREREKDRERDRKMYRDRHSTASSHADDADEEPFERPRSRDSDRPRSRESDRPRSRESDRDKDYRPRDRDRDRDRDYDRPRARDRDRDRDRDRERDQDRDRNRERDRERERDRDRAPVLAFSRPATYDPRLAQRSQPASQRRHDDHGARAELSARRRKQQQLKDELGLSDDDALDDYDDGDDGESADERRMRRRARAGSVSGSGGREAVAPVLGSEAVAKLQVELAAAREGEQRAHESLSKLQLLSKSQTAILKTSMLKKLQAREALVDELAAAVKELERQLRAAGVAVREFNFNVDEALGGRSAGTGSPGASPGEAEAIDEIGAMKAELERLMDENKALREKTAAGQTTDGEAARKAELDKLRSERERLVLQLKEAQLQLATPVQPSVKTSGSGSSGSGDSAKAVEQLTADKKKLVAQLKEMQQQLLQANVAAAEAKTAAAKANATAAAAASVSSVEPVASSPPAPAPATAAGDKEALQALRKQLADIEAQRQAAATQASQLQEQLSALQTTAKQHAASSSSDAAALEAKLQEREAALQTLQAQAAQLTADAAARDKAWEDKHARLKATAEGELAKIKEQAKRAILDLKRKLDGAGRAEQDKRRAVAAAAKLSRGQKTELAALKAALTALRAQHLPALVAQVSEQLGARLGQQSAAMAGVVDNYKRELKERKRLFNLVQELKGNIRVLCRVRPISKAEVGHGSKVACKFPSPEEITLAGDKGKSKTWEFDRVFDSTSTQEQVFHEVQPLVTSILDGYSVCIFAYGQTGSGKTFTMAGPPESPGINTRSLQELFTRKAARATEYQDDLTVSVLEIYNEQIRDLLAADAASTNLQVRQGPTGNFVPGLTVVPVQSLDEVFELIKRGNKNRSTHATDMNEHSSRSHSILSVQLRSTNIVAGTVASGRLFLVDLAGSERLSKTGAEGQRLKEAQSINKSLSALGDVIAARASRAKHVPYRNSALTYLLQDALGGDSKTLMVACASPVDYNSEESFCTLNFAARARSVEMGKATKNVTQAPAAGGKEG